MGDSVAVNDLYVRPLQRRTRVVLGRRPFGRGQEDDPDCVPGRIECNVDGGFTPVDDQDPLVGLIRPSRDHADCSIHGLLFQMLSRERQLPAPDRV